ncbi:hypothetical protein COJ46_01255 [Bacillus sp. AFS077874]|uniref:hypothetical protein n=1 Tax=unclassified Bacillus (in: firmicutes) TaxID=185979 RepID=UPI000BEC1AE8|nr:MULTISPECIES: hypothetical protein [unclassified Bacillus (in: firmicutes)]PEC50936.1 hypothetical protein CON00_04270 [Bacillus sp. AFS096315]PFM83176.1 hypothetical protein COJ46_01255 [Bacillus sp. AFS077874]
MNLNPIFNNENYKKRRSNKKTRSDKKSDIKIYVSENTYNYLYKKSSSLDISMTELVSNAFYVMFRRGYDYQQFKYTITDYMVHVKLCKQDNETLGRYAGEWMMNKRKAATNIFNNILYIRGV